MDGKLGGRGGVRKVNVRNTAFSRQFLLREKKRLSRPTYFVTMMDVIFIVINI